MKLKWLPKFAIPITVLLCFLILLEALNKFGFIFVTIMSVGFMLALLLIQLPASKSVPWLIGFVIMPFDSIYSSIPILSRFNSSAPYILILGGSILLVGKTRSARQGLYARLPLAPLIILTPLIIALITRLQQVPRNMILLAATIFYLHTFKKYIVSSTFNPMNLVIPIVISSGAYSVLMLLFKNPVSLITSGNFVNKLDGKSNPGRLTGFGNDYEVLGLTLSLGLVACFYLITMPNPPHKFMYSAFFGSISVSLLATASVTSMLLAFLGVSLIGLNSKRAQNMHYRGGRTKIIFLVGFFIIIAVQVIERRLSQRGIQLFEFLETGVSPIRLLNREQIWLKVLSSTTWERDAIFGQGWPYPYELLGSWPHSTLLGIWITGGLSLLIVSLIVLGKSLQLVVAKDKSSDKIVRVLALLIILGSFTIDLYRTSSLIFLAFTILFTLYWESQKPNVIVLRSNIPAHSAPALSLRNSYTEQRSNEKRRSGI